MNIPDNPNPAPTSPVEPVTPGASAEARSLLQFLYDAAGSRTLTGQHCNPLAGSTRLEGTERLLGRYPAVFGQDFGFSAAGTWDGINFRQQIVEEAIRRHEKGFINTLMWHAVRPQEDEPVLFKESIQAKLSLEQWEELITSGTRLNERWKAQVDVIAWFLKQLKRANVPVLWRPYHEMNGGWFWWGKKPGENGYKKLYRMLFERLVHFHGLNNLLWVFNANEVWLGVDPYDRYYPGVDVVDILATDVYRGGFSWRDYKSLLKLANDKPIALGEVGKMPSIGILRKQPRWSWFMLWFDPYSLAGEQKKMRATYDCEQTLTWEDLPWVKGRAEGKLSV